jgi:hypothetical protein
VANPGDLADFLASRSPEELAGILHRRPEVRWGAPIAGLADLADRLNHPGALEKVLPLISRPSGQLLHGILALGPAPTLPALLDLIGPADDGAVDLEAAVRRSLQRLQELALAWRTDDVLRCATSLPVLVPRPMGIGMTVGAGLERASAPELAAMREAWGLPAKAGRAESIRRLVTALTDQVRLTAMLRQAPTHVRDHLDQLAQAQVMQTVLPTRTKLHLESEDWARRRGLLFGGHYYPPEVPVEVVLAIRGDRTRLRFSPTPPEHPRHAVDARTIDTGAAAAAADATQSVAALIDRLSRTRAAELKAGGVGSRELVKIGKALGLTENRVRFDFEILRALGLLTGSNGVVGVTPAAAGWRADEPGVRFADVVAAWWTLPIHSSIGRDDDGKVLPAAGRMVVTGPAELLRVVVLTLIEELGPDHALSGPGPLVELLSWHRPYAPHDEPSVAALWLEAHAVGALVDGALSPIGRALLDGDAERLTEIAAGLLAPATSAGRFGSDLTVMVAGSPSAAVSGLLDTCADREGRGAAVIWRFSPISVRRALDEGWTAAELTTALREIAEPDPRLADPTELPQPLTYLIADVARRHGHLVVLPAGCCVRSSDPALLLEMVTHRGLQNLRPHAVTDTVAVFQHPPSAVLEGLRGAGFAPVPADADGVVDLRRGRADPKAKRGRAARRPENPLKRLAPARPAPDAELVELDRLQDLATQLLRANDDGAVGGPSAVEVQVNLFAPQLALIERRQLAFAIEHQRAVVITYESATGGVTNRAVSDLDLVGGHLDAWCHLRDDQRMFNMGRIRRVVPMRSADRHGRDDPE